MAQGERTRPAKVRRFPAIEANIVVMSVARPRERKVNRRH
jgi:hypothetical protein